jgi:tungstate transport system substrate-binding protein
MVESRTIATMLVPVLMMAGHPARSRADEASSNVVRTAVIGGMMMTGLWPEIASMFEAKTGYRVQVVAHGPRAVIAPVFREGQADLITMHSGDVTTDLAADGYGINMRPWTRNELVVVGPADDPAGIAGMTNGAAALRILAEKKAPLIDVGDIGAREVFHNLWQAAGIRPRGDWLIKDESPDPHSVLQFARERHAYAIVGRMPILFGRLQPAEGMEIMVQGDPAMRRPYIVMEANPARFPATNNKGAHALAEFLLSDDVQAFLADFGRKCKGDRPLFYPLTPMPIAAD